MKNKPQQKRAVRRQLQLIRQPQFKPEEKFAQLTHDVGVSRTNATTSVGFTQSNPVVMNPWNVLTNITNGTLFGQRVSRRIFVTKIVYEYAIWNPSGVNITFPSTTGTNVVDRPIIRVSKMVQKKPMSTMPLNLSWPFQTGLTYPFDSSQAQGGFYNPVDENNTTVYSDKYVILSYNKALQHTEKVVHQVNHVFEFQADNDQTSVNDSAIWQKMPYLYVFPGMDAADVSGTFPLQFHGVIRLYYTDV